MLRHLAVLATYIGKQTFFYRFLANRFRTRPEPLVYKLVDYLAHFFTWDLAYQANLINDCITVLGLLWDLRGN